MVRIANRLLDCIVNYSAGEEGADIGDMDEGEKPQIPHDDFID